ncbi:MAG: glycosyltransferase [Burkholderiales bacterium]|nr:glycosyltransferase [Burkholderiales bacterium]
MRRPVVHLYTVCWDEADMLGFFFRHYDPWVDRYVIYDDGSTDGSREILRAHPKVELRDFVRVDADSFVLSHKAMQDHAWKESRGHADWIVVTAIDEHLHVRGRTMADYLAEQTERGVTLVPALGFDMNDEAMPEDRGHLVEVVTRGRPRIGFNKLGIFKPEALRETGFTAGRHAAAPVGDLRLPARDEVMLWHYKHLGFERNAAREAAQAARLGTTDVSSGYGSHYLWSTERLRAFWDEMGRESSDLSGTEFVPDQACVRPLWWEQRAGMSRVDAAPLAPLTARTWHGAPTVSVLIKTYNHAPYAAQAIQSVLDQSFQDFEIVVTDDGSTDETLAILRTFSDPRIRLEALPANRGISTAMNVTVARARGRYLAILNSDDWALPGRLRKQVAFLDANPDVSLVFGLPRAVDEAGLPTAAFNDFRLPLTFPDFARRTWLRQFFFHGNCLCAPSAMIRREAYDAAGSYDPRLTNLQDLDMWIRMLTAGHNIHVLPEPLTAFRIRDGNANMSAPTAETHLRSTHESIKILERFAEFSEDLFREVFDTEADSLRGDASVPKRIAELSHRIERIDHQHFALDLLFRIAQTPEDLAKLREWGGSLDVLHLRAVETRDRQLGELHQAVAQLTETVASLDRRIAAAGTQIARQEADLQHDRAHVAGLETAVAERDGSLQELQRRLVEAQELHERVQRSLSWRSTAFLRWLGRAARALRGQSVPGLERKV